MKNWFEWGALRNINVMKENIGKMYIFKYYQTTNSCFYRQSKLFGGDY